MQNKNMHIIILHLFIDVKSQTTKISHPSPPSHFLPYYMPEILIYRQSMLASKGRRRFCFILPLLLMMIGERCNALTLPKNTNIPKQPKIKFPSWITTSAAFVPVLHMAPIVSAMDGGGSSIPSSAAIVAETGALQTGALQIPLLAGYLSLALYVLPKAAKTWKKIPFDDDASS